MHKSLLICIFLWLVSFQSWAKNNYVQEINLASEQRLLTQKIAKEAILVSLNLEKYDNLNNLSESRNRFEKIVLALIEGDDNLAIKASENPRIIAQLEIIIKLWRQYDAVVSQIINTHEISEEDVNVINELNIPLLIEANNLVNDYLEVATGLDLNQNLASAINMLTQQKMLIEKISKEVYLIALNKKINNNQEEIKTSLHCFEDLTNILMNNALGKLIINSSELAQQLTLIKKLWQDFKLIANAELSLNNAKDLSDININLNKQIDYIISLIEKDHIAEDKKLEIK
jgi:hypothetical protein